MKYASIMHIKWLIYLGFQLGSLRHYTMVTTTPLRHFISLSTATYSHPTLCITLCRHHATFLPTVPVG